MQELNLVITVAADGLAPSGARPSAGTLVTVKIHRFSVCHGLLLPFSD